MKLRKSKRVKDEKKAAERERELPRNRQIQNYEGKMIGFGDKLSDKEIDSVLAYIKSFWSKENYEYQLKLN